MKHILQKHEFGCAIACVAMVAGISYRRAMKVCHPKRWFWQRVKPARVDLALNALGIPFTPRFEQVKLVELTKPSIVIIQYLPEEMYPAQHWWGRSAPYGIHGVVWDPETGQVLDPARQFSLHHSFYEDRLYGRIDIERSTL